MAREMSPKAEVEVELIELIEDHDYGAIGMDARQPPNVFPGVSCVVIVDVNEVVIDYQNIRRVEYALAPLIPASGEHRPVAAQQLDYRVTQCIGAGRVVTHVFLWRYSPYVFNTSRSKFGVVVTHEHGTGHIGELHDN